MHYLLQHPAAAKPTNPNRFPVDGGFWIGEIPAIVSFQMMDMEQGGVLNEQGQPLLGPEVLRQTPIIKQVAFQFGDIIHPIQNLASQEVANFQNIWGVEVTLLLNPNFFPLDGLPNDCSAIILAQELNAARKLLNQGKVLKEELRQTEIAFTFPKNQRWVEGQQELIIFHAINQYKMAYKRAPSTAGYLPFLEAYEQHCSKKEQPNVVQFLLRDHNRQFYDFLLMQQITVNSEQISHANPYWFGLNMPEQWGSTWIQTINHIQAF